MKQAAWAVLLLAAACPAAQALEHPYFGLDAVLASIHEDGWAATDSATAVQLRAGTDLTPHFGLEGRMAFGVTGGDADLDPAAAAVVSSLEYMLNYNYSVFLKGQLPLGEGARLYGLAGIGLVQVAGESSGGLGGATVIAKDLLPGYGAGIVFGRGGKLQFNLDYVFYPGFADAPRMLDTDIGVLSAGIRIPVR